MRDDDVTSLLHLYPAPIDNRLIAVILQNCVFFDIHMTCDVTKLLIATHMHSVSHLTSWNHLAFIAFVGNRQDTNEITF